jgi:hypothetical protein
VSKQTAILVALALLATAATLVSLGAWILIRRGRAPASDEAPPEPRRDRDATE